MINFLRLSFFICLITLSSTVFVYSQNSPVTAPIVSGVQRVNIIGGKYFFVPDKIIVKVNIPVELKVWREKGFIPLNIVINAPDAGIKVRQSLSNTPKIIRFTPYKTGNYTFYCDKRFLFFESYRDKGMKGILKVVK